MKYATLISFAALLPAAYGLAFEGPEPTADGPNRALQGTSPAPTKAPTNDELKKRQDNITPPLCGWVDGDWNSALTCSASRTCMLYKSASMGMAGCCLGSDRQNCGWANSCVNYNQYTAGNCGANCLLNQFVRKCTNIMSPYCQTYTYLNDGVMDYDCGSVSTTYTVRMSASNPISKVTRTIKLATVAAASVTGIEAAAAVGKKAAKLAIGAIVGIVIAVLFIIFCVIIGVCFCLKRKKKQKQIAANAQIIAANQANQQPQYQAQTYPQNTQQSQPLLQQHNMMQQQPPMPGQYAPPMPSQSPQPQTGYFSPTGQQKYEAHVQEYAMTPMSNPPTPAPAYNQPYSGPNSPPMPQQAPQQVPQHMVSPVQQYRSPAGGAVEVDAISVPHAPNQGGQPGQPVYEMGQGR